MAATPVRMPKLGMAMEEGAVLEWTVAVGKPVEKGAVLLVIENEKAANEIEATLSGVLRHVYVEADPDARWPCGALLADPRWQNLIHRPVNPRERAVGLRLFQG